MAERRINYTDRDFVAIRQDLNIYVHTYYPDLIGNFNDSSLFFVQNFELLMKVPLLSSNFDEFFNQ
jgi:hypothetical protein